MDLAAQGHWRGCTEFWEFHTVRYPSQSELVYLLKLLVVLTWCPVLPMFPSLPSIHNSGISFGISPSVPQCSCSDMFFFTDVLTFSQYVDLPSLLCALFCACSPSKVLFCFPCPNVLPVFPLCPVVFPPFLNNCIPVSVRLYSSNTPSIPQAPSLSQQNQKGTEWNWSTFAPD